MECRNERERQSSSAATVECIKNCNAIVIYCNWNEISHRENLSYKQQIMSDIGIKF